MKIVTSKQAVEEQVLVSIAEIKEFQRIGALLAKVVDARTGWSDSLISIEADGYIRILRNDDVDDFVELTRYPEYLVQVINNLKPQDDDDDDDDDDDADDDEDEDEDEDDDPVYSEASEFLKGVQVRATRDILVKDLGLIHHALRAANKVLIPKGTRGTVLYTPFAKEARVAVAFEDWDDKILRGTSFVNTNRRTYPPDALEVFGCACKICLEENQSRAENYPR